MKRVLCVAMACVAIASFSLPAIAQDTGTTRWVVGFDAGGSNDYASRIYAEKATQILGRPFVVENRPGAGGAIGAEYVANSPPDGHTILTGTGTLTIDRTLKPNLPFNVIDSFEPVAQFIRSSYVVVVRDSLEEVQTIEDLVEYLNEHPGELNYGSPGIGTQNHLATEFFLSQTGTSMEHIPYGGEAPTMTALMSDDLDVAFITYLSSRAQIEAGTVRAIAVASTDRFPVLPDVPTISETVSPGFEVWSWFAAMAPKGTPQDVITTLNETIQQIGRDESVRAQLEAQGFEVVVGTPEDLQAVINSDIEKWGNLIRTIGLTLP